MKLKLTYLQKFCWSKLALKYFFKYYIYVCMYILNQSINSWIIFYSNNNSNNFYYLKSFELWKKKMIVYLSLDGKIGKMTSNHEYAQLQSKNLICLL